jgi:hypothetical protein
MSAVVFNLPLQTWIPKVSMLGRAQDDRRFQHDRSIGLLGGQVRIVVA